MSNKSNNAGSHRGLQGITLCISTSLVLILLGLVIFFVLTGKNMSAYVRENIVVTMMMEQDMTSSEAQQLSKSLRDKPYVSSINYISKEEALKEGKQELGTDPSEFIGTNPYLPSIELHMKADYANNDSLNWITSELKKIPKVTEVNYQHDLVNSMNQTLAKIGLILFVLAMLLTFISFSLINNTVRLGIYSRRFAIHTMKLVGASWKFIRRPFVRRFVFLGVVAAIFADAILGLLVYFLYLSEPEILTVVTWMDMIFTFSIVVLFGIVITAICASISVNKFLKMKAGDLYKI